MANLAALGGICEFQNSSPPQPAPPVDAPVEAVLAGMLTDETPLSSQDVGASPTGKMHIYIFYGGNGSGKSFQARRLAEELRVAHGWSSFTIHRHLPLVRKPVIIIDAEQPIGMAAFDMLASGLRQSTTPYALQTLIIGMHTDRPSPIAPEMPVSLIVKVHALQTLLAPHLSINDAVPILKLDPHAMQLLVEIRHWLPYKVWLILQLPLLPEMHALVIEAFKTATKDPFVTYLTSTIDWVTVRRFSIMEATITRCQRT